MIFAFLEEKLRKTDENVTKADIEKIRKEKTARSEKTIRCLRPKDL